MKIKIRLVVLLFIICTLCAGLSAAAEYEEIPFITGETSRTVEYINLADGTETGVKYTTINISGYYGTKVVRATEFSLGNKNLSVDVINHGSYLISKKTVAAGATSYVAANLGKTVLSAVNGDLYFNNIHSNTEVTKAVLACPRGIMIIDREIWASEQINMENHCATNIERDTPSPPKNAFGVTTDNQPLVGSPVIAFTIKNETKNRTFKADGFNRLPCLNSIIIYNKRINSSNYALNDSLEIELEAVESSAMILGGTTKAIVKNIYPAGSATRPAIGDRTIIITARGTTQADISNGFSIGDVVSFSNSINDRYGNTTLWNNVSDAIGGHMPVLFDGNAVSNMTGGEYPTTLIGYKDDGTVMFCCISPTSQGKYLGLKQSQALEFCKEMGYNSVFYLDGGGSTETVVLENGTYKMRNFTSDSSTRAVINSVAVVWNETPVIKNQGTLSYIKVPVRLKNMNPVYLCGEVMDLIHSNNNAVDTEYNKYENAYRINVNQATVDPFTLLNYSNLKRVNADDYPYIVLKIKNGSYRESQFKLYFSCGSNLALNETNSIGFELEADTAWHYYVVKMSGKAGWTGVINSIRLDPFNDVTSPRGDEAFIHSIVLCKSKAEAESVQNGFIPEGAITDYAEYIRSIQNTDKEPEIPDEPDDPEVNPILPDRGENIIAVMKNTSVGNLLASIDGTFTVVNHEGAEINEKDKLCTGYKLIGYNQDGTEILNEKDIIVVGDVTGKGNVSSVDALFALRYSSGLYLLQSPYTYAADVNNDSKVNSADALMILKYSAGLISSFD